MITDFYKNLEKEFIKDYEKKHGKKPTFRDIENFRKRNSYSTIVAQVKNKEYQAQYVASGRAKEMTEKRQLNNKEIAKKLKAAREEMDFTQKDVGIILGVDAITVSHWERGISLPAQNRLVKLKYLYKMSDDDFFEVMTHRAVAIFRGEELKRRRLEARLSGDSLANALGVSANTIWQWESGRRTPSEDNLKVILDFFNLERKDLVEDKAVTDEDNDL